MKISEITADAHIKISLWNAIKLRIAGINFKNGCKINYNIDESNMRLPGDSIGDSNLRR
jgi:hypothetical protein